MKKQEEYSGAGSINSIGKILKESDAHKIFLVTGKKSYSLSGAEELLKSLSKDFEIVHYNDFGEKPELDDIRKGINIFRKSECDYVIACGGGNVIDTAKSVNILSAQIKLPEEYLSGGSGMENPEKKLTAIPTTAGAGSEATHFAVIYDKHKKYSLAHEFILPDSVILDPELTYSLSPETTAISGIDALSQAIESYWSVNSTEESKSYSSEAIKIIFDNLNSAVNNPGISNRLEMLKASNLSGKSINISKTTAPHAVSYAMTSYFGIPHGQAVSITLGEFILYNNSLTNEDINDKRGIEYVKKNMEELFKIAGCKTAEEMKNKIQVLMRSINLKTRLTELGIKDDNDLKLISGNVNTERLQNNPRSLTEMELLNLLMKIL